MYNLAILFSLFIIYSAIGYIIEIIAVAIDSGELNFSRGFLIGPIIPIFGVGGLLLYLLLNKYLNDIPVLFIMAMVMCTTLEYMTSYIMEKIFGLRWWDYSDKKMNLNGRVCLSNAIGFGFAGTIITTIINPRILGFLYNIPINTLYIISIIILIIFLTDLILSTSILVKLKLNVDSLTEKDATPRIKREVRKELSRRSVLTKRLIRAFPDLSKLNKSFRKYRVENLILGRKRFNFFKNK